MMKIHLALLLIPTALAASVHLPAYKWTSTGKRPDTRAIGKGVYPEPKFGACADGYYCASDGGQRLCCPNDLSEWECGEEFGAEVTSVSVSRPSKEAEDPPDPEPTPEQDPPAKDPSATPEPTPERDPPAKDPSETPEPTLEQDPPAEDPPASPDRDTASMTHDSTTAREAAVPSPAPSPSSPEATSPGSSSHTGFSSIPARAPVPTSTEAAQPIMPDETARSPTATGNASHDSSCSTETGSSDAARPVLTPLDSPVTSVAGDDMPPDGGIAVRPKPTGDTTLRTESRRPAETTTMDSDATATNIDGMAPECEEQGNSTACWDDELWDDELSENSPSDPGTASKNTPSDTDTSWSTDTADAMSPPTRASTPGETATMKSSPSSPSDDGEAAAPRPAEASGARSWAPDVLLAGAVVLLSLDLFGEL